MTPYNPLVKHLCELLGLPKYTQSFELRVALDEPVTITCTYFLEVEGEKAYPPPPITEKYYLVRQEDAPTLTDEIDVSDLTNTSREFRKRGEPIIKQPKGRPIA